MFVWETIHGPVRRKKAGRKMQPQKKIQYNHSSKLQEFKTNLQDRFKALLMEMEFKRFGKVSKSLKNNKAAISDYIPAEVIIAEYLKTDQIS